MRSALSLARAAGPGGAIHAAINSAGITVPAGALDRWFTYRTAGNTAALRRDVIIFGDSTTFGSGGNYSWVQRIRDRSVAAGYADGGKGIFAGSEDQISYDAPEVNGLVSVVGQHGFGDGFDNIAGNYLYDDGSVAGATVNAQFRATAVRIWFSTRPQVGSFKYSIDGGSFVTVNANTASAFVNCRFVYVSGLSAGTTHTLQIVNLGGGTNNHMHVAIAPVNGTGVAYEKHAVSGATINGFFWAGTASAPFTQSVSGDIYQSALGLNEASVQGSNGYAGMTVDTGYAAGAKVNPVLAITHLGFNDLTAATSSADLPMWTEYIRKFAAACRAASCDGLVLSGQLPYNANWPTYGAARFNAVKAQAATEGLGFVDLFYPIGGASLSYAGGTTNPHLTKTQYQTQADFLWDNLLNL